MERRLIIISIFLFSLAFQASCFSIEIDSLRIEEINQQGRSYALLGDFDAAEKAFRSILSIDPNSIKALNNLGVLYKLLGRNNDALRVYTEAENIINRSGDFISYELALIYLNKGIVYKQKQDFELSLQYMESAANILSQDSTYRGSGSLVYNNIGNVYAGMNDWRRAIYYYKQGITLKESADVSGLDISYANCASSYEKIGRLDSAEVYYNLSIQKKIERDGEDSYKLISTYNNYAILLQRLKRLNDDDLSYVYLLKALEIANNSYPEKHPILSECYSFLGDWHMSMKNLDVSADYYQKAINAVIFDFISDEYTNNPSLDNEIISSPALLIALRGKSDVLAALYNIDKNNGFLVASLETLELSNLLTEKMRSEYLSQESKLLLTENSRIGYEKAIALAHQLYELTGDIIYAEKAFVYSEKSKSSVLLASLQEVENKKSLGVPVQLQEFERELKFETDFYKKKLYEERQKANLDSSKLGIWQNKILYLSQQHDSISQVINNDYPEYKSKYDNDVISLTEAMQSLSGDQALLSYSLTDSSLFIFVLTDDDYQLYNQPLDNEFRNHLDYLSAFLRDNDVGNTNNNDYQSYISAAYSLYKQLVLPVEKFIGDKNLIIIPDGELGYIPFETLLSSIPSEERMDYRNLPYLIHKYRINYSYSATLFFKENDKGKRNNGRLLAFAPVYNNIDEISSNKFLAFPGYKNSLVNLKFNAGEINSISNIVEGEKYIGDEATEETFRQLAPEYDILHLAMHTLINEENPMYSQLVFTLNSDTLEENDGLLNVYEIFSLPLSASMAVLSACNTGSGQIRKGEGVMSLARGFIYAGVPSIVMTLWAVEDQSGAKLMSHFYKNLVKGHEIDEALNLAKLQYLETADQLTAHPYFWSGYVSIGSTDPIVDKKGNIILPLMTGIIGLFIIILMIIKRIRLNKMA